MACDLGQHLVKCNANPANSLQSVRGRSPNPEAPAYSVEYRRSLDSWARHSGVHVTSPSRGDLVFPELLRYFVFQQKVNTSFKKRLVVECIGRLKPALAVPLYCRKWHKTVTMALKRGAELPRKGLSTPLSQAPWCAFKKHLHPEWLELKKNPA